MSAPDLAAPVSTEAPLLRSFFLGGFECSMQRREDGVRLDLLQSTGHDVHAERDYRALASHGIRAARDGIRWHLVETSPGRYDWSSVTPMLEAAARAGTQVIWDLAHYGWPDDLDIWSDDFVPRFADYAAAAADVVVAADPSTPAWFCPVNEISFWAWAGGEVAHFNPCASGRGTDLKRQLVRASLAGMRAIRARHPSARFIHAEPAINILPGAPEHADWAEGYRMSQYQALDMLAGRIEPELGGHPDALDVLGVNFYPHNQWVVPSGDKIPLGHPDYKPFVRMLGELHARYGRPIIVAETGAEGDERAPWFEYVCGQVEQARQRGIPVGGICLYPVTDYPGWLDDRHCPTGLLGFCADDGARPVYPALADQLERQSAQPAFA